LDYKRERSPGRLCPAFRLLWGGSVENVAGAGAIDASCLPNRQGRRLEQLPHAGPHRFRCVVPLPGAQNQFGVHGLAIGAVHETALLESESFHIKICAARPGEQSEEDCGITVPNRSTARLHQAGGSFGLVGRVGALQRLSAAMSRVSTPERTSGKLS
jgi:hypothetical protein